MLEKVNAWIMGIQHIDTVRIDVFILCMFDVRVSTKSVMCTSEDA